VHVPVADSKGLAPAFEPDHPLACQGAGHAIDGPDIDDGPPVDLPEFLRIQF
jgi:hypothetical protein